MISSFNLTHPPNFYVLVQEKKEREKKKSSKINQEAKKKRQNIIFFFKIKMVPTPVIVAKMVLFSFARAG